MIDWFAPRLKYVSHLLANKRSIKLLIMLFDLLYYMLVNLMMFLILIIRGGGQLLLRCPQCVGGIIADPQIDWSFDDLISELNSIDQKLHASTYTKTQSRYCMQPYYSFSFYGMFFFLLFIYSLFSNTEFLFPVIVQVLVLLKKNGSPL